MYHLLTMMDIYCISSFNLLGNLQFFTWVSFHLHNYNGPNKLDIQWLHLYRCIPLHYNIFSSILNTFSIFYILTPGWILTWIFNVRKKRLGEYFAFYSIAKINCFTRGGLMIIDRNWLGSKYKIRTLLL